MARVMIAVVLILIIGAITSSAQTTGKVTIERNKLFTGCAPMDFVVEELDPEDTQKTGLTKQIIANAVESRLRAARLFTSIAEQTKDKEQYLYINVGIATHAFNVNVDLDRYLKDIGYGFGGYTTIWHTGGFGTHGGDGTYILGTVSKYLDQFIVSYLRVNEAHCSK